MQLFSNPQLHRAQSLYTKTKLYRANATEDQYRESDLFIYTEVPLLYIHINIHTYSWNLCDGNTKITLSKQISLQAVYGALQERFSNEELFSSYFHTFKALSFTSIHLFSILENCCTFTSRVVHSRRKLCRKRIFCDRISN